MMKESGKPKTSTSYQYDSLPPKDEGKTYEQLMAEGYEHVYSFRVGEQEHIPLVQHELRIAQASGRYLVTVVKSDTSEKDRVLYIVKKLKPESKI